MSPLLRRSLARVLAGGACLLPLAVPAVVRAQPGAAEAAPTARPMTSKELHQHLARGAGWVRVFAGDGVRHGTGWILDHKQKLMVTNSHVVEGCDEVTVTFPIWKDGKLVTSEAAYQDAPRVRAVVIDRDALRDLALVRVDSIPEAMHALKLATAEPDEGDEVRTIGGFTDGGDGLVWGAVTGVVRACGPQELDPDRKRRPAAVREVLSDARTNGGNSGAPVVNAAGEVVAVHFAKKPWAAGVARHVSVVELKAYLKDALPLVEPRTGEQFLARARRRLAAGRTNAAILDAGAALGKQPRLAAAMVVRGEAFLAKEDPKTAVGDFEEALRLEPGNYDVRVALGKARRATGRNAEAVNDFSAAIRTDPARPTAYNERGLTHYFAGEFAEAEPDFGRAIDASPKDPVLWANRAEARGKQGKLEQAVEDWARGVELAPGQAYYPNGLGLELLRLKRFDAAADAFALAVKASEGAPLYLGNLGRALALAGRHEAAVKSFTSALDEWKKLADVGVKILPIKFADEYSRRAGSRAALGQYKDAAEDLTKAIELTDRKVAHYFAERARAFEGLGEKAAAEADRKAAAALGFKFGKDAEAARMGTAPPATSR